MFKNIFLINLVGFILLFSFAFSVSAQEKTELIYFWGDGCPHCANVQAFFDTWEKKDQISLTKLEVWNNRDNASLMAERAKSCNINPSGMGVPFLVTPEGKCLTGD